ncbi:MAG TPA: hypothetical protein VGG56_14760 [Terracidiphilus sp.]|jgi:hypothetical protein
MRNLSVCLALAASLLVPALRAQTPDATATMAACPSTATLDQLISAIDAAVSGPADKDRACFRALFLPDARLIPIRIAADGTAAPLILNVDGWIAAVSKRGSMVLTERQIKVRTESWAHIAHLWSTYTTSIGTDDKPADRGINSIQAVFDGKQWHIIEITWQAEKPDDPVPAKYLP